MLVSQEAGAPGEEEGIEKGSCCPIKAICGMNG